LHLAFGFGRIGMAAILLPHGADPTIPSTDPENPTSPRLTPLGHLFFPGTHHAVAALEELISMFPRFIIDNPITQPGNKSTGRGSKCLCAIGKREGRLRNIRERDER